MCSDWPSYFNKTLVRSLLFENKMADKSPMRVYNRVSFFCAFDEVLSYFKHNSTRAEQRGCLRRIICLREDVLAVLEANLD